MSIQQLFFARKNEVSLPVSTYEVFQDFLLFFVIIYIIQVQERTLPKILANCAPKKRKLERKNTHTHTQKQPTDQLGISGLSAFSLNAVSLQ